MTIEDWISRSRIEERNYPAMSEDYHNLAQWLEELQKLKSENAELKRLLKLAMKELVPDICDYCVNNGSKRCEEANIAEGCGNMACQFVYWRHYDEVKGLIEDGNEMDTGV